MISSTSIMSWAQAGVIKSILSCLFDSDFVAIGVGFTCCLPAAACRPLGTRLLGLEVTVGIAVVVDFEIDCASVTMIQISFVLPANNAREPYNSIYIIK